MKELCYIVQGITFLKSVMPMIIFSNTQNIKPVIFFVKKRNGKDYDSLINKKEYVESLLKENSVICECNWVDNQAQALSYMNKNNLYHIVCQDAQHHGKIFCHDKSIKVYSIGVFFDTLHYANDLRLGRIKYKNESSPDIIYFPDQKFNNEFKRLYPEYNSKFKSLGSPLYDHSLFFPKWNSQKKSVCFLATLQRLVSQELQAELEKFIEYCIDSDIDFYVKTKYKTPWSFKNKNLEKNFKWYNSAEVGFPYTSLNLILNTDIHISSFSTSAVECKYFNKPCINLDSIDQKDLTYAVNSIKYDYKFSDLFNSKTCKTVNHDVIGAYNSLTSVDLRHDKKINLSNNNSTRILNSIKENM
jgi:hypothetical protein